MDITNDQQSEITFINGITRDGVVAPQSFITWNGEVPVGYLTTTNSGIGKWGSSTAGTGAAVTYSFNPSSNWSSDERTAWKAAFDLWSNVADIKFNALNDGSTADVLITRGNDGQAYAYVTAITSAVGSDILPIATAGSGNISIDTNTYGFGPIGTDYSNPEYNYPFGTIVHEIGHVIGLGHAGPYNGVVMAMPQQYSKYDMYIWSTMSYIPPTNGATRYYDEYPVTGANYNTFSADQTPMMLDIAAIQQLYGAPTSGPLTQGGQIFGFHSNISGDAAALYDFSINKTPVIAIWDAGDNNTLDLSEYRSDSIISLEPGTFSSVAGMNNNLSIAFDTIIETALGGQGNDRMTGAAVDNYLKGNAGDDYINGAGGFNVAEYNNPMSKYAVTISATDKTFSVQDKTKADDAQPNSNIIADGFDSDINIQQLKFADNALASSDFSTVRAVSPVDLETLVDLYVEINQRAPDSLGLIFWGAQVVGGATLQDIASAFLNAPEGQANFSPSLTTQQFVNAAYQSAYNRPADQGGLDFWSSLIDSGKMSRSDLFISLTNAPFGTTDGTTLFNKMNAGGYFSAIQGLNDGEWSVQAIAGVGDSDASLEAAYARINSYAGIAATEATSQLTVKLLGIDSFGPASS